ncbi:Putative type I restriction enzyme specificity protein HI_0216 (plasmid) [Planktothrix agardhii]|jgi:type I restriction enzyme S subunit|uniref:restriction endonuclease subunit S n=1 Tax=Planktothrix agardhii TaxID=1160 RepID=UPI0020A6E650|nr:restriction endonuclease subunit S [Planktothrix agardhii]CAD5984354.1 Putative type I restriction enzyme specificity protein HI_0216 [Planktothrix agardhii]
MNRKFLISRYPAYKDSGIEWLGAVPEHWSIVRNKKIFKERNSLSTTGKETLLTVSHITGVTPRSEKNVNMFMAETMEGYKICHHGDLIINTMWAWMGALGTSNELGICSPSYNVYMPIKGIQYNHRYFDYLFRIPNAIVEMARNSKGIVSSRLRLYAKEFFQIETVLPSLEEQKAIANYLDNKTAQIDRKIDLLTEKAKLYNNLKQSLINETVTRGLDKTVPMKDSGIEWIGEIPEHWEVRRVKDELVSLDYKRIPLSGEVRSLMLNPLYDYYGASGIIDKVDNYIFDEPLILIGEDGANLLMRGSPLAFIARGKYWVNNHAHILKPKKGNLEYFCYLLESFDYTKLVSGSAQPKLTAGELNNFFLMVAPLSEQKEIADYLDTETSQIDKIIETINTKIEKLKELRKTLINDVVTGKIKVV